MTWSISLGSILFAMFSVRLGGVTIPPGKRSGQRSPDHCLKPAEAIGVRKYHFKGLPSPLFLLETLFFFLGQCLYWLWFDSTEVSVLWLLIARWALSKQVFLCKEFPHFPLISDLYGSGRTYLELEDTEQCRDPLYFISGWFRGQRLELSRPCVDQAEGSAWEGAGIDGLRCLNPF